MEEHSRMVGSRVNNVMEMWECIGVWEMQPRWRGDVNKSRSSDTGCGCCNEDLKEGGLKRNGTRPLF